MLHTLAYGFVILFQESWMIKTCAGSQEVQQPRQTETIFQQKKHTAHLVFQQFHQLFTVHQFNFLCFPPVRPHSAKYENKRPWGNRGNRDIYGARFKNVEVYINLCVIKASEMTEKHVQPFPPKFRHSDVRLFDSFPISAVYDNISKFICMKSHLSMSRQKISGASTNNIRTGLSPETRNYCNFN